MLLTFTGRRSGKEYTTPVNFFRVGEGNKETLLTTSRRERTWWRNLRDSAEVHLLIGGKDFQASARAIEDPEEVVKGLSEILEAAPGIAKYFDVRLDQNGKPAPQDLKQAAEPLVIVRSLISEE
ncbi:MAG: nitroreductase/quinone reductase family protein [Anaerolineales bacterium]